MKKILFLSVTAFALASCQPKEQSTMGVICDASMNTMMIVDGVTNDTLVFSTVDAQIESPNGILIGDTAHIFYQGDLVKGLSGQGNVAQKVVVTSAVRVDPLLGAWTQPINGMEGVQGVQIDPNGVARSINMSTLVYESWAQDGDSLVLAGKSIGNGQTIDFAQKAAISKLDADSLILNVDGMVLSFAKAK